jgi:hypothetical protein
MVDQNQRAAESACPTDYIFRTRGLIGGGESHRVSKGDVVTIPPDAPHMYKNIEEPFRYLVVQTP